MKKHLQCCCAVAITFFGATAQNTSPYWSLAGNSNATSTSKLGTTNAINLGLFTNNVERLRVNTSGNIGIGTITPSARLHVNSATGVHALIGQVNSVTKFLVHSAGGVSVGSASAPPANGLFVSGNTGIGTSTPESRLHVFKGSAGAVTGYASAPLIVENSTHSYINILSPTANETGILFGNPSNAVGGGIIYNNVAVPGGFQFRTNNNTTKMVLNKEGRLGIGTTDPELYLVKISHQDFAGGFAIENASTGNHWELYVLNTDELALYYEGLFKGKFSAANGTYSGASDGRLKTDVTALSEVLPKISSLKPSLYTFKNAPAGNRQYGFIAQEVQKVFPEAVTHVVSQARNLDIYTIDYNAFAAIAIKAIQELKEELENLKSIVRNESGRPSKGWLSQNSPNPVMSSSSIQYVVTDGAREARILITDSKGQQIKIYNVSGRGTVTFNASTLAAGVYNYSLVADGETVSTKKLVVSK